MSNKNNQAKATNTKPAAGAEVAPVNTVEQVQNTQEGATDGATEKQPDVVVTENAPAASTSLPVVPTVPAVPVVAKTRLFWQKSCHSLKESTNTEIKAGEVFVKTPHTVQIENPDVAARATTPLVVVTVYSLKRGKRIYYTPYVTPEQAAAADVLATEKANEKAAKEKAKADEKAKKEQEKLAKAGTQGAAVAQPAAVAPTVATESTATVKEEELATA